ncbi:MAG: type II secretion system F family protein [Alphaproteobacteria bacterium]
MRWSQFGAGILKEIQKRPGIQTQNLVKSANTLQSILKKIEHFLYRGGLPANSVVHILIMPAVFIGLCVFIFISQATVANKIFAPPFITLLLYLAIVWTREQLWRKKFIATFPHALDIIGRGLKSGLTLVHGMELVSRETEGPVQKAFKLIISQLNLGIPLEKVLYELAVKIDLDDFRIFALGLTIQKETGGSLLDILEKLSLLIRERDQFDKKLKALSAEGKATAKILGSMPLIVWIIASISNKEYVSFFIYTQDGQMMLAASVVLSLLGIISINRMSSLDI